MIMATSVLNFLKRNLGKTLLASSLFATAFAQAQTGNPIAGYAYLGSCTVSGQPHYYYVSTGEATWPDANTAATNLGGYLATLTSQGENDCVSANYFSYLTGSGLGRPSVNYTPGNPSGEGSYYDKRNPWIGLTDAASEGTFIWANGENCNDFKNWDCGTTPSPFNGLLCEPNNVVKGGNSNGEDYVQLLAFYDGPDNNPGGLGRKHAGFWNDWFNTETQLYIIEFGPNTCNTVLPRGNDGCSHGYWKNAKDNSWTLAGYNRTASFMTTFGITNGRGVVTTSTTLQQSLELNGGGYNQVAKQGTGALLNAGRGFYPYTTVEVITAVRQMFNLGNASLPNITVNGHNYTGGTFTNANDLASYLDMLNNLGCPLNNKGDFTGGSSTTREGMPSMGVLNNAFTVSGYPNPSRSSFNIQVSGLSTENVSIKVTDMTGRLIEQRTSVPANQTIQIGTNYRAGLYYIEVSQGAAKQQLKMVKQ